MAGHLDTNRLRQKAAYVRSQTDALRLRTADSEDLERLLGDSFASGAVKYALQTAIEAIIDTAYHLAAKLCGKAPESAADAFRLLAGQGLLTPQDAETFSAMARFRNKVEQGGTRLRGYPHRWAAADSPRRSARF